MKQTKITAFLALAFILGVAAPIAGITIASNVSAAEQVASTTVSTETDFRNAIENGEASITLSGNINLTSALVIERAGSLTIDLNEYKITAATGIKNAIIIMQGNVHFTGTGSIEVPTTALTLEGSNDPAAQNYSTLVVDKGVTITAQNAYGVSIDIYHAHQADKQKVSYGVAATLNGTIVAPYGISVNGNIQHNTNIPVIKIGDSAVIDAMTNNSEADSTPIYAAGAGNWTVGKATLTGRAAVGMKAGTMTFNGTKVEIDGVLTNPQPSTGGIQGNNSVFQIEHHASYAGGDIVINVNGGEYTSVNGDVFYEYNLATGTRSATDPADININGGTFTAGADKAIFGGDVEDMDIEIKGGTFTNGTDRDELKQYLVGNLTIDSNGTVIATTSPSRPTTPVTPTDPETPDTDNSTNQPDTNLPDNKVPDTGVISEQGIITAISTTLPLLAMAGVAFIWFNRHMVKVRRAERMVEEERERIAKAYIPKAKKEATIDRFVATPVEHHNPDGPMVDMFTIANK